MLSCYRHGAYMPETMHGIDALHLVAKIQPGSWPVHHYSMNSTNLIRYAVVCPEHTCDTNGKHYPIDTAPT